MPFPYSDLTGSKRRPVLVVSNDKYNQTFQDTLVCVITSNLRPDDFSVCLDNDDLEVGILPEKSSVKAHKLFTIHQNKIIRKFSVVTDAYFAKVTEKIQKLIRR